MEEAEVADRIAMIADGKIVALDTPRALRGQLGGGVIRLHTEDNARASAWLAEGGYAPQMERQQLMLVHRDPAGVLPIILRELPVKVQRVEMHEPSLEDVFIKLTGRGLEIETPAANGGAARRGPNNGGGAA
jgi:ABC-2 type transport system ATP-binding protein